ncbi:MAG: hypothetical protein OXU40_00390 [Nitrospira sp.]|nr:hypothetical protein [Nitrospira sp.]
MLAKEPDLGFEQGECARQGLPLALTRETISQAVVLVPKPGLEPG